MTGCLCKVHGDEKEREIEQMTNRVNLTDLEYPQLEKFVTEEIGEPKFRAKQIFSWIYGGMGKDGSLRPGAESFEEMNNLPKTLREKLTAHAALVQPAVLREQISKLDGTRKFLFGLADGNAIESVFMKYKFGNSICVSSQAGCRMGCRFCASTIGGLKRNLTPGEIAGQILAAQRQTGERISHVVVMGTGEPFDNYDNLAAFIRIINDSNGLAVGMRNITVSTCGLVPKIARFAEDFPQVNLAISLHAASDEMRSEIMPVNKTYPMDVLLAACREYTEKTSRRITFEYTLVKGVNDSTEHAKMLASKLHGMLCHVNLIPLNKVEETGYDTTERGAVLKFQKVLNENGIPATIRRELGDDIDAACGQLRLSETEEG